MAIFQKYVERLLPLVPTILRRKADNILNLTLGQYDAAMDALAAALVQYIEESWPLVTASGWLLDAHWGPYHNIQRNGDTDDQFRIFIRAKRLLNRSWGAADQALVIFRLLLPPAATLTFTPAYPKYWTIQIGDINMSEAAEAIAFMTKGPSPQGGGFSVCGDGGFAIIKDAKAFNYKSVYGVMGVDYQVTGWFTSFYGAPGSDVAGYAHAAGI
jgi:hypothetical protein